MDRKINIQILLMQKKIKQRYLAIKFNVSDAAISRLISGKMESSELKIKIAKELNVNYEKLWAKRKAA